MRVMVAGAGLFGREHLLRLCDRPALKLAVADPNAESLRQSERICDLADSDPDPFRLLDRFRPDALIVATPASTHIPIAQAALAAAVPVLVEKPVAENSEAVGELVSMALSSDAFILPGHVLRFCPWHQRLIELVRSGVIGEILAIQSRRYRDSGHVERYPDIDPILMTLIHDIDIAIWIDGHEAVQADVVRTPVGSRHGLTSIRASSAGGTVWQLETAWVHPGECPADRVQVLGTLGTIELEPGRHIQIFGKQTESIVLKGWSDPLRREQDWFLSAVARGDKSPPFDPLEAQMGLRSAELFMRVLK